MSEEVNVYVTIGAPASGKSTWAKENFLPHEIVSSDYARYLICGDESNQRVTGQAWSLVNSIIRSKLQAGQYRMVIDATSVKRRDRVNLVQFIRTWMPENTVITGVVFAPEPQTLFDRDFNRERTVGTDIIQRMLQALKSNPPSFEDGFDRIVIMDNAMFLDIKVWDLESEENK